MAEKQCNLLKNGGGMSRELDYANVINNFWTRYESIDATGFTYTVPKDGVVSVSARVGRNSTATVYSNDVFIAQFFTHEITSATTSNCPVCPLMSGFPVKKGDVIKIALTYGSYAWTDNTSFIPYK